MKKIQTFLILLTISTVTVMSQQKNSEVFPKIATLKTVKTGERIQASPFEYSGQVTAVVFFDGFNYENEDYCLYSIVKDEIRGTSRGIYFSPTGQWLHPHLVYSNEQAGETISFRLYDKKSDKWYEFEEKLVFTADMIMNDARDPFILKTSNLLEPRALSLEPSLEVFPNPSRGMATIKYSVITDQMIIIQVVDIAGRVIDELVLGKQTEGQHQYQWDTSKITVGVYTLRLKNQPGIMKQVVLAR